MGSYFWSLEEASPVHCSKLSRAWSQVSTRVNPVASWSETTVRSAVNPLPQSSNKKV